MIFDPSTMALKVRDNIHLARRLYHTLGVGIVIYLYQTLPHNFAVLLTLFFSILTLLVEFFRFRFPAFNKLLVKSVFGPVLRRQELRSFSGMTFLILGVFIVVLIFPKPVGTLALLFLALADPAASVVGILYGRDKIVGNKSLQGALAAFVVCMVVSIVYFNLNGLFQDRLILATVVAGLVGALSELVPVGRIDDNFTFPVISASLLWILFKIFGGY